MADRLFERAFSRAAAASASNDAERPLQPKKESLQAEAGAADKVPATPMQVSDAVQRVLQADQDKDYFRYMFQVCKPLFIMWLFSQSYVTGAGVSGTDQKCHCLATDLWSCHSLKQMNLGVQS